jgi:hypothetical protein
MYSSGVQKARTTLRIIAGVIVTGERARLTANWEPFGVIEHIEGLRSELKSSALLDSEVLEDSHIEVYIVRIAQAVPPRISKRQSCWSGVGRRIVEQTSESSGPGGLNNPGLRIAYDIRVGGRSNSIGYAGVIVNRTS